MEETMKAIRKQFRRASVKIHPDHQGEDYRSEFNALIRARDTLVDTELRYRYVEQMLEIICKVGTHLVKSSHDAFVRKHQPDLAEQNARRKKKEVGRHQQSLQIEGGILQRKPRKPSVVVLNASERKIRITMPAPGGSLYDFDAYCRVVQVVGERADVYNEKFDDEFAVMISKEQLKCRLEGEIECEVTLPGQGVWDIRWSFWMEVAPGELRNSELSTEGRVDLVSPKLKAKIQLLQSFEVTAKRRANDIDTALRILRQNKSTHSEIQENYTKLQEAVLKARHTEFHLEKVMNQIRARTTTEGTPLQALREAIRRTSPYKKELERLLAQFKKRAAYKTFKAKVYDMLEDGAAAVWISNVADNTLKTQMSGDANRLYQLLMEGKKAYSTELVDAAVLYAAAGRSDLFTPKQVQAIIERAEQVEILAEEEAKAAMLEIEEREEEEWNRRQMEQRAGLMERGEFVQLQGLTSEPELNGVVAMYMGLGQGDHYILRIREGREVSVRKENFSKWDSFGNAKFVPPPPKEYNGWICDTCTFYNDGPTADKTKACSMCGEKTAMTSCGKQRKEATGATKGTALLKALNTSVSEARNMDVFAPPNTVSVPIESEISCKHVIREQLIKTVPEYVPASRYPGVPAIATTAHPELPTEERHNRVVLRAKGQLGDQKLPENLAAASADVEKSGSCKFRPLAEDIAAAAGHVPYASPPGSISRTASNAENCPEKTKGTHVKSTILISAASTSFVIGRHGKAIASIKRRSRTNIRVDGKRIDANGMCPVHIRGKTQEDVDNAASIISQKAASYESSAKEPAASTDGSVANRSPIVASSPIAMSSISNDGKPKVPMHIYTSGSMKDGGPQGVDQSAFTDPVACKDEQNGSACDMPSFIRSHERSLKCSSVSFSNWLKNQDIETLNDLAEACTDEKFVSELCANGLKKFKSAYFRKSAAAAAVGATGN